jgi:hypothetical protein
MKVLVACEYSAIVRDAFRSSGHDAWSCDLLATEGNPDYHVQGDILTLLDNGLDEWDLLIAHPPCTYLANSGVRWLHERPDRWKSMIDGACFFRKLLTCKIPLKAIENPVIHKYAKQIIGRGHDQTIQPWQFGHGETKRICLWLDGLKPLTPTNEVDGREARVHRMPPGPDRQKERSRFFTGVANAMADQWG